MQSRQAVVVDRTNSSMQAVIDEGIALFERGHVDEAVAFLAANRIPDAVVRRVLYYPESRRQYINDYLTGF